MPVDYNNMVLFSPGRARAQAENELLQMDQIRQRNALAEMAAKRDQQAIDMDRQRFAFQQQQAERQAAAAQQDEAIGWIRNAIGVATRNPQAIPALMRAARARGFDVPENITPEYLSQLAIEYGADMPQADAGGLKIGNFNPGDYTPESFARFMQSQKPQDLQRYVTPAQDKIVMIGGVPNAYNPRGGYPRALSTLEAEAAAKQREAAAAASGRLVGEAQTQAAIDFPKVKATAEQSLAVLDQLYKSKGFNYLYGKYSYAPIIGGTPQADADALLQQIGGAAFLQAFETLKGGGQITQVEGEKATAAITRLTQRRQQPSAAREALRELQGIIRKSMERAEKRAGGANPSAPAAPAARIRFDENGNMVR